MSYDVYFTNILKNNKITVEDQVINNSTSLSFVGKNYMGYGKVLAENFLHLLENFASETSPLNPVEGQLWYDTTTKNQLLKVYDGSNWNPAGSVKKSVSAPSVDKSISGDLWVNLSTNQLYMYSGTTWDLIGPQYSTGLKSGPVVEVIDDILDESYAVMVVYSNNDIIAIFSSTTFTPKNIISGFDIIKKGINLSTSAATADVNKLWGTAESADGLIINNEFVGSSNFLRADATSITNKSLSVQTVDGISVGSGLEFKISTDDTAKLINLTAKNNRSFKFEFIDSNTKASTTGLFIDNTLKIGIGTNLPLASLDVNGSTIIRNSLTVGVSGTPGSITATSKFTVGTGVLWSTLVADVITVPPAVATQPTAQIGGKSVFSDTIGVYKELGGPILIPKYTADQLAHNQNEPQYDIGSEERPFRDVYATTFHGIFSGTLQGSITGSINGSATTLKTARSFKLDGDITSEPISFDGSSAVTLAAVVSPNIISKRTAATSTLDTDLILTYNPNRGLLKTSKSLFLSTVPAVPVGAILPYAGVNPPTGYLFCDGSELPIASYTKLYEVLGFSYRSQAALVGDKTFALPDLRGRFPLGKDNMDNNLTVVSKTSTTTPIIVNAGGNRNSSVAGSISSDPAKRVNHESSKTLGSSSGNEALGPIAVNGVSGTVSSTLPTGTSNASSVMNPYQTINYIIFTGILQ
jgi:microcystin-dependent protein